MIQVRKSTDRGLADHGWLISRHTFSFSEYYDPKFMGFGPLRVINEDRIEGGAGFDMHPHHDMEIISYVIEGGLRHKDSMGNEMIIEPGDVQRMSAGTGVRHSEYNLLPDKVTHLLQIWILPEENGLKPGYAQKSFLHDVASGNPVLVVAKSGRDGSITVNQDVDIYVCKTNGKGEWRFKVAPHHHHIWVQVVKGEVVLNEVVLSSGDGAGIRELQSLNLAWKSGSEFLLFDML